MTKASTRKKPLRSLDRAKVRKALRAKSKISKGRGFPDTPVVPAFLEERNPSRSPIACPGSVIYLDADEFGSDDYAGNRLVSQPRDYAPGGSGIFYPHGFKHAEPKATNHRTVFLLCVLSALTVAAFFVWLGA